MFSSNVTNLFHKEEEAEEEEEEEEDYFEEVRCTA